MAAKINVKTTFEVARAIEPIYTGGEVSANADGSLLATTVDDDILVVDVTSGRQLLRIDGDGESLTSISLSPTASHLVVCSRSLLMRIYALSPIDDGTFSANLTRTLKPHTAPVICSTIDQTGSILVTGSADGTAKVWDIRGGYCSHTFHGHGGLVTALELFESVPATSRQTTTAGRKRKLQANSGEMDGNAAKRLTLLLATGGEDGKIKLWDLSSSKNVATLDSHVSVVRSITFSSAQNALMSTSRDKTIVIWDPQDWTPRRIIPSLETLESGGFVSSSIYCYSGGENGRLRIWNTQTGQETTKEQHPGLETEAIVAIIPVPMEQALLTIHQDQTMVLHSCRGLDDLTSGKQIPPLLIVRRISGNHDEIIDMACVGSDRSKLALATNTESIKIISISETNDTTPGGAFGSDVALLEGHQDIIICLDVDYSGHWLATGAKDNTARLWRLDPASDTYECFAVFQGHAESLGAISLPKAPPQNAAAAKQPLEHPPSFLITGSQDKTVKRWDTSRLPIQSSGSPPHSVVKAAYTRVAHEKDINAIDTSPIEPLFASASQDRTIKIWSVEDGSTVGILRGHKRGVWSVKFSPSGTPAINLAEGGSSSSRGLLLSGSGDRSVKIWSMSTYTCLQTFEGHGNSVLKVLWLPPPVWSEDDESDQNRQSRSNPKQPMIASASSDTLVKIWTPYASSDSDHLLATLDNHTDRVWSLASPYAQQQPIDASEKKSKAPKSHPTRSSTSIPFTFISGAADASLTFWKDTTTTTAAAVSKHMTERIEQDQQLQNHIHARNYRESITLALTLNHPGRLLKIFEDIISQSDSQRDANSITGIQAVDEILSNLSTVQLYRLLERIRDWNTSARTAPVAQRILNVVLRSYPAETWTDMAKNQRTLMAELRDTEPDQSSVTDTNGKGRKQMTSVKDLFRALQVYTERHYKRVEELVDESYLIEYTLREMDEMTGGGGSSSNSNGVLDGGSKGEISFPTTGNRSDEVSIPSQSQDVVML